MRNLQSASSLPSLADRIVALVEEARQRTVAAVNTAMVYTYFEIGRQIVEEEQGGKVRAGYGERLIRELSRRLTARFGKGFSPQNLANMKKFYLVYSSTEFSRRRLENQGGASQRSDSADAVCKGQQPDIRPAVPHGFAVQGGAEETCATPAGGTLMTRRSSITSDFAPYCRGGGI